EAGVDALEGELDRADRTVAVLGEDQLRLAADVLVGILLVVLLAEDEADEVGVLLEVPRFTDVREDRPLVGPQLGRARELRETEDRHPQLAGWQLEPARDLADLLDAARARVVGAHELHVVDDDQPEPALARI